MKNSILLILLLYSFCVVAQIDTKHLEVGDKAPEITGIDQFDTKINSTKILKNKKIILVFYRGNWCPYCRKHLASLQENLEELSKKGLFVIVVTPEKVEKIQETTEKLEATFSIIHDVDNSIMENYKVAFTVNEENVSNNFGFTQRIIAKYNTENSNTLPVPATYLIDEEGKIIYVHYDPDHHERSDFKEIIKLI